MDTPTTESALEIEVELEELAIEDLPLPIGDRVLVRRDAAATKSDGGILLPDSAQTKPKRGLVIGVGPGRILDNGERAPMDVEEGDHVWFSSYAGTDLNGTEEESGFVIMRVDDIMAVDPPDGLI